MVDVYIPQDVWTYMFSFIPIPKIKYNKVGFYLDQYEKKIVHITKISKCFMWFKIYEMGSFYDIRKYSNNLIKEVKRKNSNVIIETYFNMKFIELTHRYKIIHKQYILKAENSIYTTKL
jgi:hypothetical protein